MVAPGKMGISTWEELLDLWRELERIGENSIQCRFGITPIVRCRTSIDSESRP
jgi:hypothetical protein